jgi:hypothetical protein
MVSIYGKKEPVVDEFQQGKKAGSRLLCLRECEGVLIKDLL